MTQLSSPLAGRRICVLTTGHLATTPRMTKAADAFAEAGATVHVISTSSTPWAVQADRDIMARRGNLWISHVIDYRSGTATHLKSGIRQRGCLAIARIVLPGRLPLAIAGRARERVLPEIVAASSRLDVDFVYGGGAGLAATMHAARKLQVPFGVDLEDFHTGDQSDTTHGRAFQDLSARIERDVLPAASLRTAGSEDIAQAYRDQYGLPVVTVNNAFSISDNPSAVRIDSQPLRLYWFSQTIGSDRGLEDAVAAVGIAGIDAELHLQGVSAGSYVESLIEKARSSAPTLRIVAHPPCMPDEIVAECSRYDVGLCLEVPHSINKDLCLSNKALAFVAAGLAIILTDTRGQRRLAADLGEGGFMYASGDTAALAAHLARLSKDSVALSRAKNATLQAARSRWRWDHRAEKETLVGGVAEAVSAR